MATSATRSRFHPATRDKIKLRIALDGPSGSGKTFTGLRLAFALAAGTPGKRVAVIDSEREAASLYKGLSPDGFPWEFHVLNLSSFAPTDYTSAIEEAAADGCDVLLIDSLSHAWEGKDGALELVDRKGGNRYTGWKDVTPMHRRMVDAILNTPMHVIVTMRSKTEYVLETNEHGKQSPRKIGMAPIQRPGMEYEFTIYGSMDWSHVLTVTKDRTNTVDGAIVVKPGPDFLAPVMRWLATGESVPVKKWQPVLVQDEQLTRIVGMIGDMGMSLEKEKAAIFKKYLVTELAGLTGEQATEYEKKLGVLLAKKRGTPAASQPTASANGKQSPPQAKPPDIFALQKLAATRDEWYTLKSIPAAPLSIRADLWTKILSTRGVTTARNLTTEQVAALEANLRKECNKMYAADPARQERLLTMEAAMAKKAADAEASDAAPLPPDDPFCGSRDAAPGNVS